MPPSVRVYGEHRQAGQLVGVFCLVVHRRVRPSSLLRRGDNDVVSVVVVVMTASTAVATARPRRRRRGRSPRPAAAIKRR
ncbi:hypothetical protein MRX96_016606 [Rhipicephalus microplus]